MSVGSQSPRSGWIRSKTDAEFAKHERISKRLECPCYFATPGARSARLARTVQRAHPSGPSQKDDEVPHMRHSEVAFVQDMINGRRRKSLGGKRPKDFLRELAKPVPEPASIAAAAPTSSLTHSRRPQSRLAFGQKLYPKSPYQPSTPICVMRIALDSGLRGRLVCAGSWCGATMATNSAHGTTLSIVSKTRRDACASPVEREGMWSAWAWSP